MRSPARSCPNCGARVPRPGAQASCDYCEHALEVHAPPQDVERAARFARLLAHPDLPALLARQVSATGQTVAAFAGVVLAGAFVVFALILASTMGRVGGPFAVVPLLVVGVGVLGFVRAAARGARLAQDPGRAYPALVADEREQVDGGRRSSVSTSYFATLEDEGGGRLELTTSAEVAGRIAPGDFGVAYERAGELIDFVRLGA